MAEEVSIELINNLAECLKLSISSFKVCMVNVDLKMQKFWDTTIFHHYTDHGYNHSLRIITYLEAFLDDYPDLLNQSERFILLASIYLHDIGMQSPQYAGLKKKVYTEYTREEIETVRKLHHTSSEQMILDSIKRGADDEFGLRVCKSYVKFIAEVAKHHTKLDISLLEDTHHLGEEIKLRLLAALMRLGDALDMDSRRVNLENLRYWDIPVLSKFHWWAHHYVSSIHIEEGKIGLIFTFPETYRDNPVIIEFRKEIEDSIKRHLDEVYRVLFDYNVKLFHEHQVDDVVYDVEGVHEPIPQDLLDFLNERLDESARIQRKAGVHYVDGVLVPSRIEAEKKSNAILGIEHKNFEEIHLFLDEINTMLDGDFFAVKRVIYPNSWKIGLAYYDYKDKNISYSLYPIPISRNDVQIKEITDSLRKQTISQMGATSHFVENPIKLRPREYAVDIIEEKMDRILENKLLNHKGNEFLAKEFVYAFTYKFHRQLGLERKEQYNLSNIEAGFHKFLPLWTQEAMKFLVSIQRNGVRSFGQLLYRRPYFNPDMLISQIFKEELITIDQNVRKRLERKDDVPSMLLGNDKFPFIAFVEFLSFLKTKGIEKINRVYSPKDFTRTEGGSGLKWNLLSPNAIDTNLKIFFSNLPEVYEEIVSNNFPRIKEELKIFGDVSKTIVTFDAKDSYEVHKDAPSFKQFNLKAEVSTSDYEISVYKEGDDALPKNLSWNNVGEDIEINGVKYKLILRRLSILDFIFDDLPMFNFLYDLITDNLKRHFNLLRQSISTSKKIWVQDLEEGKASNYIKNSQDQNPKLEYFTGPPMREKKTGYVGMYYHLRLGESP